MIIFFVGLPGSGKTTLAKNVALDMGIPFYESDLLQRRLLPTLDPDFEEKLDNHIPLTQEVVRNLYQQLTEEVVTLKEQHEFLIVDGMFNEKETREEVFLACKEAFGKCVIIWVNTPRETVKMRLEETPRKDHLLKDAWGTYQVFEKIFDPAEEADIVVFNESSLEQEVLIVKNKLNSISK